MEKTMLEKQEGVLISKRIREKILKPFKSINEFNSELKGCIKESKLDPLELKKIWAM